MFRNRLCIDGGLTLFMPPTSAAQTVFPSIIFSKLHHVLRVTGTFSKKNLRSFMVQTYQVPWMMLGIDHI